MGYSCSKAATERVEAILNHLVKNFPAIDKSDSRPARPVSNGWTIEGREYFFQQSRVEHADGSITGTVYENRFYKPTQDMRSFKVGSVQIEGDGTVTRWATVSRKLIDAAILEYKAANRRRSIFF